MVAGPVKVIPYEDPRIASVQIDVDVLRPGAPEAHWRALMAELQSDVKDPVIAYRAGHRWVQFYEPASLPRPIAGVEAPLRDTGVYLVTGGLGGIGLAIARHLAKTTKARLVLTSRREVPPRTGWEAYLQLADAADRTARDIRAVQELEALGAEVLVSAADVCDEPAMRQVVSEAIRRFGAINGVVHSAGVPGG